MTVAEIWQRGQAGWPRCFPVVQAPNPPLLVALAGRGIAAAAGSGSRAHGLGRSLFLLGLAVWAWEEMTDGANWFRRLLGAAGLVSVVAAHRPRR